MFVLGQRTSFSLSLRARHLAPISLPDSPMLMPMHAHRERKSISSAYLEQRVSSSHGGLNSEITWVLGHDRRTDLIGEHHERVWTTTALLCLLWLFTAAHQNSNFQPIVESTTAQPFLLKYETQNKHTLVALAGLGSAAVFLCCQNRNRSVSA